MTKRTGTRLQFTILAAGLLLTLGLQQAAQAQGMRMSPEQRVQALKDSLSLTAEQTTKITKIFEAQQKEMMEKMGELQGDRDAMRQAFQEMTAKTDKQIEALLSKEQLKKYEAIKKQREQMRSRMQQRRQGG